MSTSSNQPPDAPQHARDETRLIRHRYDRVAPFYDGIEAYSP